MARKIIIKIAIIAIYSSSTIYMYNWMSLAFSKGGRWANLEPDGMSLVFTFCPVVNTVSAAVCLLQGIDLSGLYNIKK